MKTIVNQQKHKQKNPTTNYPKDSHKSFCKRCFAYNKGCPETNSLIISGDCTL